jgi:RHS repeat-associated protein
MGARFLDPKTGRFTQPDPVGLVDPATGKVNQEMLVNPQRQNRYVYALNNPYRYIDPDGRNPDVLLGSDPAAYYAIRASEIGADINSMKGTQRTARHVQKEALSQLSQMVSLYGGAAVKGFKGFSKIDSNKVKHIFEQPKHNLESVVEQFGSKKNAFKALQSATEGTIRSQGIKGVFETSVKVETDTITVRGNVIDKTVKIGTAYKP